MVEVLKKFELNWEEIFRIVDEEVVFVLQVNLFYNLMLVMDGWLEEDIKWFVIVYLNRKLIIIECIILVWVLLK